MGRLAGFRKKQRLEGMLQLGWRADGVRRERGSRSGG